MHWIVSYRSGKFSIRLTGPGFLCTLRNILTAWLFFGLLVRDEGTSSANSIYSTERIYETQHPGIQF